MKRSYWLAILAAIVLIATLAALANAPIGALIEQKLIAYSLEQGVGLRFEQLSPNFIGMRARRMWIVPKGTFFGFETEENSLNIPFFSLLNWQPRATISAKLYQGSLNAELELSTDLPRLNGEIAKAQISDHPQLMALGVSSGELYLSGRNLSFAHGDPPIGEVSVQLLDFSTRTAIRTPFKVGPVDLTVPALKSIDLSSMAQLRSDSFEITELTLESAEHGKLTGQLRGELQGGHLSTVEGNFNLELLENSLPLFAMLRGFYGSTLSDLPLDQLSTVKSWRLTVSGSLPPQIIYSPGS